MYAITAINLIVLYEDLTAIGNEESIAAFLSFLKTFTNTQTDEEALAKLNNYAARGAVY